MAMQRNTGFTLIELLVSSIIMAIVMIGVFQSFSVQNENYVIVDQVTEAQQNLRAVVDLIERDVRLAGYMVPRAAAICAHDYDDRPDVLFVSDADKIRTVADLEVNAPELMDGNLGVSVQNAPPWGPNFSAVDVPTDAAANPELYVDVAADGADFVQNAGLILVDRNDPEGRVACGQIFSIVGTQLLVNFGPDSQYPNYTPGIANDVVAIPAHMYQIQPAGGGLPDRLFRDGLLLANDVEDLQVVFYIDDNDDRIVDIGEVFGDGGTPTYAPANLAGIDMTKLREVRVNVVTATSQDDPNQNYQFDGANFTFSRGQATANRALNVPGPDRRRRRLHSATVRLRNLG